MNQVDVSPATRPLSPPGEHQRGRALTPGFLFGVSSSEGPTEIGNWRIGWGGEWWAGWVPKSIEAWCE